MRLRVCVVGWADSTGKKKESEWKGQVAVRRE